MVHLKIDAIFQISAFTVTLKKVLNKPNPNKQEINKPGLETLTSCRQFFFCELRIKPLKIPENVWEMLFLCYSLCDRKAFLNYPSLLN